MNDTNLTAQGAPELPPLPAYDAGLLSDFGGGSVDWWQDYIRAELGRAHDFYESHFAAANPLAIRTLLDAHASALADSKRLDWLETQGYAYGFEDMHEGNRWAVEGPYNTVRKAIDADRAALDDNTKGAAE